MDTATSPVTHRGAAPEFPPPVSASPSLIVTAIYTLSEAGRKASLLAGGDGRALQRVTLQVPPTRLHLVSVDANGVARLKLQPRFEFAEDQRVIRRDGPPVYDVPPRLDDLFSLAARNHERERDYHSDRARSKDHRREADRERRLRIAEQFLADPAQRAMAHPIPTPTRCFVAGASGRVMFDGATDVGPSRDLPREAYRRFRTDLRLRKEANLTRRAEQLALHEEKTRAVAVWVVERGSDDQRARHAAGLLPVEEVIDALTEEAFAEVADQPRYPLDGAARLQAHLRAATGRANILVATADLQIAGAEATAATAAQWAVIRYLQAALLDASVTLREHRLSWRRESALPTLTVFGVLVTRRVGPFIVRREFAAPGK